MARRRGRRPRPPRIQPHFFASDGNSGPYTPECCLQCKTPRDKPWHKVQAQSEQVTAFERRRLGESDREA